MPLSDEVLRCIEAVADLLRGADSLLFITGAGISAESGLPTYRGIGGMYERRVTDDGIPIEVILSGPYFAKHPEITWKYLLDIGRACSGATYNRGHEVIAQFEKRFGRVWVLTQNVDGLHRAAGSTHVIDIHGDMRRLICTRCEFRRVMDDPSSLPPLPTCPDCRSVLRPDVVLFEELLPMDKWLTFRNELDRGFDIVFSVGTSSQFPYIIEPVYQARARGIPTVEINPATTEVSDLVAHRIRAGAAESLDALGKAIVS